MSEIKTKPMDTLQLWHKFTKERTRLENRRTELRKELQEAQNAYLKAVTSLKGVLIEGNPKKVTEAQNKVNKVKTARDTAQLSLEALGTNTVGLKKFIADHPDLKANQELEVFIETALPEMEELEKEIKYLLDVRIGKHFKAYCGRLADLAEKTTRYYDLVAKFNLAQDFRPEPQKKRVYKVPQSQAFEITWEDLTKEIKFKKWPSYYGS